MSLGAWDGAMPIESWKCDLRGDAGSESALVRTLNVERSLRSHLESLLGSMVFPRGHGIVGRTGTEHLFPTGDKCTV
jgi:hypothetical protein